MDAAEKISRAEGRGSWRLWFGLLVGPAAWTTQIIVNYLVDEIACAPASTDPGRIWGVSSEMVILAVNIVLASATILAGVIAYRCLRATGSEVDTGGAGRVVWMARVGIMSSVLFLIAIGLGFPPAWMLGSCEVGL